MARVFASESGTLWRMSEAAWRRLLRLRASGKDVRAILPKVAKKLGDVIDLGDLQPETAKERLREEIRKFEREAPSRIAGPGPDGKLKWTRLSPGSYRTRATNGKEYEIYRVKESGVPAVWLISVGGEDVGSSYKDRATAKAVVESQNKAKARTQ